MTKIKHYSTADFYFMSILVGSISNSTTFYDFVKMQQHHRQCLQFVSFLPYRWDPLLSLTSPEDGSETDGAPTEHVQKLTFKTSRSESQNFNFQSWHSKPDVKSLTFGISKPNFQTSLSKPDFHRISKPQFPNLTFKT